MPQNAAPLEAAPPRHLLVLDPRQPAWGELLVTAGEGVAVLVLDAGRDGLIQIAEVAAELAPLDSLRLTGPGGAGRVQLGTATLEADMPEERNWVLAALGRSLCPEGRVELGGLAGAGAAGGRLVAALGRALGRDVVADERLLGVWRAEPLPLTSPAWVWAPRGRATAEMAGLR